MDKIFTGNPLYLREGIISQILAERIRQDGKWGEQNHNDYYWMGILGEEFGEVCKALIESYETTYPIYKTNQGYIYNHNNLHPSISDKDMEKELIQVAAVCIAWLECIERRKNNENPS